MAVYLRTGWRLRTLGKRTYSSGLLDKPGHSVRFLPQVDLAKKFEEISKLKENIELRKIEMDPVKLKSLWEFFKYLESTKLQLEKKKKELSTHMQDIMKVGNDNEVKQEMDKLKIQLKLVKEDLKSLLNAFWEVEEKVTLNSLLLPNELHKDTPEKEDKIIKEFKTRPEIVQPDSHIEIGRQLGILDYKDASCYYLKKNAALFELAQTYHCAEGLKKNNFITFCNPDFIRSSIVEGCGINHTDPNAVFTISDPMNAKNPHYRLHLVGGASIYPFCGFHAGYSVDFTSLPLKYYTIGRQYNPSTNENDEDSSGLFDAYQRTTTELFILTADNDSDMMEAFDDTLKLLMAFYEELGCHFRVVYLNASALYGWECLRASFQMYSCHQQKYVEVGKLSISDTYISERLDMCYKMVEKDKKIRFMKVLSGTAIDIASVLGCLLEEHGNNVEEFLAPHCLKFYS